MAARRNQGPQPSLSPFVLLGGFAAAVAAIVYGYPGIAAIWVSLIAAAWMEPVAVLTGKKDASGYPTAAHPGEEKALSRYKFWRDMKFRVVLPNGDWLPGWPVLGSWLGAVALGAFCWFIPVRDPGLRWVDAAAGFVALAQAAGSWRRNAGDGSCPGTRIDSLRSIPMQRLAISVGAGAALGVLLSVAATIGESKIPAKFHRYDIVAPYAFDAVLVIGCVLLALTVPWMNTALADWRELVQVRLTWAPRWMSLKKDPAPYLIAHKMVGDASVDTFQADGSEGAMAYWYFAEKITPTIGAGMTVTVLECADEGPQGPIPGSRHPLRFDVVCWPAEGMPKLSDPTIPQDVAELLMRCCLNSSMAAVKYGLPVFLSSERISVEPPPPEPQQRHPRREQPAPDENAARVAAAMRGEDYQPDAEPTPEPQQEQPQPEVGSPTSAWASQWVWPSGPDWITVRSQAKSVAAVAGVEVFIDHKHSTIYFGALTDEATQFADPSYATVLRNLAIEDQWTHIWGQVMKAKTNPPTAQHAITSDQRLADGTVVHRMAFITRQGMDPGEFRGMESKLATALSAAPFCAITGFQGNGKRPGERHPQAFAVYWSEKPVASGPDTLPPSDAALWVLKGRINTAFEAARLARPEISAAMCLTKPRASNHIWKIDLRLYGGVTLADVRGAATRLRGSLGVPWLRVTEAQDGCTIYAGVEPAKARLEEPGRDEMKLISLDWEQAWNDTGVRGSGSTLPVLMQSTVMPKNKDVKVLTFALPPGLELLTLREASKKLSTATGNEYVEIRPSERGPKFAKVLCCVTNPMPSMVAYDFDSPVEPGDIVFATGIDGDPVAWARKDAPHLLAAGTSGSGKSAMAQNLLYGALVGGCDLVIIDPTKGAADFAFLKPYAKAIIGIDAEQDLAYHLIDAAATMKAVYAEGLRRRKLNSSHGVGSYLDLPENIRPKPLIVMIDEFVGLIGMDKVQRTPFDDPDMEYDRQVQLATNTAKIMVGQMASKIAAEARAWGIHLILGTQKLPAAMLDSIPNGAILKTNLARILLGKTTIGDRMSAMRIPEEYPEMGDAIGKGRGAWEPLDSSAMMIQTWFATQPQYTSALASRAVPLAPEEFIDPTPFRIPLPQKEMDDADGFAFGFDDAAVEIPAEPEVVTVGELAFSLDDLDESLIDDAPATGDTVVPDAASESPAQAPAAATGELDWAVTGLNPAAAATEPGDEELDWSTSGLNGTDPTSTPAAEPAAAPADLVRLAPELSDTVVFLDVDGTLTPTDAQSTAWPDWTTHEGTYHGDVLASPSMLHGIARLRAPLAWLTDWGNDANTQFADLLRHGDIDVAEHPGDGDYWWKIDAVLAYLDQHREVSRIVWADHQLGAEDEIGISYAELLDDLLDDRGVDHLLVDTGDTGCLTPDDVDAMRDWLGVPDEEPEIEPEEMVSEPEPAPAHPVTEPAPQPVPAARFALPVATPATLPTWERPATAPPAAPVSTPAPAAPAAPAATPTATPVAAKVNRFSIPAASADEDDFVPVVRTPVIRQDLLDPEDPFA